MRPVRDPIRSMVYAAAERAGCDDSALDRPTLVLLR
jgi:hypothetical protein